MLQVVRPFIEFYRIASFASSAPHDRDLGRFWRGLGLGWKAYKRCRRLSVLSDEELARLGLDRASIGHRSFFGDPPFGRQ
jgi:hypothetical protein